MFLKNGKFPLFTLFPSLQRFSLFRWLKDGEQVNEGKSLEVFFEPNNICVLLIKRVTIRDLGLYECVARNEHGQVRTAAMLKVGRRKKGAPPIFLKGLDDVQAIVGGRVTLGVLVRGDKIVQITQEYEEKITVERAASEGNNFLFLKKDLSIYRCFDFGK